MPSAKHSSHPLTLVFSLLLWVFASASTADQLTLTNGDMLHGKMEAQTDAHIIWLADNFGKLKIDKQRVATINGASLSVSITPVFKNTYKGNLSFTGGFSSGNINREDWDLEAEVEWRDGDFRHGADINYEDHSIDGSLPAQQYDLNYGLDWFFRDKWYWSNKVAWGANDDRSIDQFYSVGSAIGRQFWDSKISALSAESGLLWISEDFLDQTSDRRLTWSWAAEYRRLISNNVELFHSHDILIALTDIDNTEISADLGIKVPVVKNLFTELKIEWTYDNQPALGTRSTDSQLTMGVNYSW